MLDGGGRYSLPRYPSSAVEPAVEQQKNLHATVIKACWQVTDFELFFAKDLVISPESDLHMQKCFAYRKISVYWTLTF
jgi:hypothetical protein